jgi:S-adenosylmethionine hydrolase
MISKKNTLSAPRSARTGWKGQILFIDNFENVVINITKEEFNEQRNGRSFKIVFKRNEVIETISDNYTSVTESEKLAWFNSAGYLEIALRNGNMAGAFSASCRDLLLMRPDAANFVGSSGERFGANKWFYPATTV